MKVTHSAIPCVILAVISLLTCTNSYAKTCNVGKFKYELSNKEPFETTIIGLADGVTALASPTFPNEITVDDKVYTITRIGNCAFSGCSRFISGWLTIPNTVRSIGDEAFEGCSRFTGSLTIPNSVTEIGELAFSGCSGFTGSLTIPNSVTSIGFGAFRDCSGFTGSLTIGNSVKTIEKSTFEGCSGFTGSLTIGNSVTEIWASAFKGCFYFTGSLTIPNSVKTIGNYAFSGCSGFNGSLTIGNSVETIGVEAFRYCSGLTGSLTIPNSVTEIGENAFYSCKGINTLYLTPTHIDNIFNGAFWFTNLNDIYCDAAIPYPTAGYSFGYTTYSTWNFDNSILHVPYESLNAYKTTGEWARFQHIVPTVNLATSITLNKTEAALKVTETVDLIATVLPENTTDKTVTWKSSNEAIATVDADGKVTAIAIGKATITATTANNISATCKLIVTETPAGEIIIDKDALGISGDNLEMHVGDVKAIKVTVTPETTTDKSVTFESSNASVASVDENGNISALSLGTTTITITANSNPDVKATINVTVVATPAGSISLNKTEATLKVSETVDLIATVLPETTTDKTVTWTSDNKAVATVDANGKVTAVAIGKATITATAASGISATCELTVTETPAGEIIIDKDALGISGDNLEMQVGDVKAIKVTVTPETTTDKSVTFESSDASVASVDKNGNLTALAIGATTITITANSNPDVKAIINVTVVATPAGSISLNKTEATLKVAETVDLIATVLPETTTDKTVTWTSDNEAIAIVDANGKVTAVAVGVANITGTCGDVSATCKVTVNPVPASSVTLNVEDMTLLVGQSDKLTATIKPDNTTYPDITWTSDNEVVATVDANGTVTALSVGVANITATCGDVSATCKVTVNPVPASSVALNVEDMTLLVGQSDKLTATVKPNNTTYPDITWTSDNEAVATVDANGTVTAVSAGIANIKAKCGSVSATCKVKVNPRPETPNQMLKKGNGTSCSFIVMMSLSDNELAKRGYNFVFGYTDAKGATHVIANTSERYSHTTSEIYNNPQNDFWVFAYWTDEKGNTVSSLRRHLDGRTDDDFDAGSILSQARSTDEDGQVAVYTITGLYVGNSTEHLQPGMYIVTHFNNGTHTSKKIVIR